MPTPPKTANTPSAPPRDACGDDAQHAFIVDCFPAQRRAGAGNATDEVVCATGRLASGASFGLVDDRIAARLYVRESDGRAASNVVATGTIAATTLRTMDGELVHAIDAPSMRALRRVGDQLAEAGIRTYEADFDVCRRFFVERHVTCGVAVGGTRRASSRLAQVYENPTTLAASDADVPLLALALDLETAADLTTIVAVSLVTWWIGRPGASSELTGTEEVHAVPPPGVALSETPRLEAGTLQLYGDERALLAAVSGRIATLDPDVLTGWNVVDFDLPLIERRHEALRLPFALGRFPTPARRSRDGMRRPVAARGRQILDALRLVRGSGQRFEDYRLGTVAAEILGRGKTLAAADPHAGPEHLFVAYRERFAEFCGYCLEDSRLVRDLLRRTALLELTARRSRLTGLTLSRAWGSIAAFESLYAMELRRRGGVAPTMGVDRPPFEGSPGGLVLTPKPGLHRDVLAFDYKSLYPSIMRTFNIDPLAHARAEDADDEACITAPNGARFHRDPGILPEIIASFFGERDAAKARGDAVGSYMYKIIMNSFYGVLGTDGCRFASPALASAITSFGHELLRWSRAYFESELGCDVLYGDTDSLFVVAKAGGPVARLSGDVVASRVNDALTAHLAKRYRVRSHLVLEFDGHYRRFLLPHSRATDEGRAKSYAGQLAHAATAGADAALPPIEITGMEAVRRDWTEAARRLQRELLALLFADATVETLAAHVGARVVEVRSGALDAELVYRKGIRRPLEDYTSTTPPHVKAARLLGKPTRTIHYVMTLDGPQPIGRPLAPLDYDHYIEKQLRPIAEGIAAVVGASLMTGRPRPQKAPTARSLFGD